MLDIDEYIKKYRQPYNPDFKPAPIQQTQTSSKSIDDFVKDYTANRKRTTPAVTTTTPKSEPIKTTTVEPITVTKKDYFKDSKANAEANKTPTGSNAWSGMRVQNQIIPQAKDFTPKPVTKPQDNKGAQSTMDMAKSFLQFAFGKEVKSAAGNKDTKEQGKALQEQAKQTAVKAIEPFTASTTQKVKSALTDIRLGGATLTMKTEDFDRINEAVDIVVQGYNEVLVKDTPDNALGRLTFAPISSALEGVGGVAQGIGALSDIGSKLTNGITSNKNNSFSASTVVGNLTANMTKQAYQEMRSKAGKVEGVASDLLYSAGRMLPGMLAGGVGGAIAGNVTSALNYGGSTFAKDVQDGKSYTDALIHGTFTGLAEAYLQYYLGKMPGLSKVKGEGFVDKLFAKQLSSLDDVIKTSVKSPILQKLFKTAIVGTTGGLSEATEETLQQVLGNAYQKFIFKEKTPMTEGLWQSAWMGFAMSALLGVGGNISQGVSFNEKAKVENTAEMLKNFAEEQVAQIEPVKLTEQQYNGIVADFQRQMAESTDEIFKANMQQAINDLTAEYQGTKISTETPQIGDNALGVQVDAQRALDTTTPTAQGVQASETQPVTQPQTTDNIFDLKLAQNTAEPMAVAEQPTNENLENFKQEVDTAKADIQSRTDLSEEEKADVLAHIDTVYSEITAQTAETQETAPAETVYTEEAIPAQETQSAVIPVATLTTYEKKITRVAKTKLNREVVFSDNIPEGADGMIDNGIIYIRRGADINYVFGHELTHALEASKGYENLAKYITENVIGTDNMDSAVSAIQERYKKVSPDMSIEAARSEVIAEQASKLLFADKASVAAIVRSDKGLATKILNFLRETATKLVGTEQQKAVLKAATIYRDALKETTEKTKQAPKAPAKTAPTKSTSAQEKARVSIAEKIANDSKTSGAITVDGQQAIIDGFHGVLLNSPLPILERSDDDAQSLFDIIKRTIDGAKKSTDTVLDLPTVDWLQTYVANAKKIRTQANIHKTLLKSTTGLQKKVELLARVNSDKTSTYKEDLLKKLNGKPIPEQIVILDGEIETLGKYLQERRYFAENKSGVMYDFGGKLPLVNAELLLDMIKLLPNSKAAIKVNQQSPPVLYFDGGNTGEGVLLPIRPNTATMRINSYDINNRTMIREDFTTKYAIPPSGNTVNRVGKLKSESTEKLYLAGEKYGFHNPTYKKMPLPLRMDATDSRMVGKTINTILRTDWVNNSGAKDLADDIVSGKATYQRITDKFAEKKAREIITTGGYDDALSIWDGKIAENKRMTKIDIVMAELILEQAAKQGDNTLVRKLVSEVAMIATETGQVSQAINIFNKLSGNSQLRAAEMLAKRLNKMFQKRLDKLGSVIEVNKALAEELKNATTEAEKQRIQEEIKLDLIDQLPPATFREKWDAWRMTSMLGNLRTGIRNLSGNTLFVPWIMAKNFLAFAMEEATNKAVVDKITKIAEKIKTTKDTNEVVRLLARASGDKTYIKRMTDTLNSTTNKMAQKALIDTEIANLNERVQFNRGIIKTKALKADKDAKDFAADDFQYVQVVLQGSGKYELSHKGIFESRKTFNSKITDKLGFDKVKLDKIKLKGKTLQDFTSLEGYRKNTVYMLEDSPIGDKRYLAMHYKRALSGFLTANKVDMDAVKVAQEALNEGNTLDTYAAKMLQIGREYAIKEAQEATFRNKNKLADSLNDFADNHGIAADVIINGALPFKKTPVNILYRGLEYSPAGLAKTLTIDSVRLKRGDIDVTDYINKLAKGITGTGVVLLGMGLAAAGILSGDLSDDETERKLQEQQGFQKYSLKVGDTWYSIDWAAPISLPLFLGVEILKIYEQHNGLQYKDITEGLINMTAPVINMSMLSGISEMISNLRYKTTPQAALASLPITAVRGYFTQGIPTLLGQAARTADGTRRTMSTAEDDQLNADQQYFKQKIKSKIPGVSNQAEPYLDIWGIEEPKKSILSRGAENFLSPGYVKNSKSDNLAKIMLDLKGKATPDLGVSVMPFIPDRTLTYDTKEYSLTASQLTEIRRLTGAAQQAAASAFLEKNKPVKLTYENKNKVDMTSSVTLLNAQNKSGGKYSNEDIQIKALAKTMKDAREKAVGEYIKAHNDLTLKK